MTVQYLARKKRQFFRGRCFDNVGSPNWKSDSSLWATSSAFVLPHFQPNATTKVCDFLWPDNYFLHLLLYTIFLIPLCSLPRTFSSIPIIQCCWIRYILSRGFFYFMSLSLIATFSEGMPQTRSFKSLLLLLLVCCCDRSQSIDCDLLEGNIVLFLGVLNV